MTETDLTVLKGLIAFSNLVTIIFIAIMFGITINDVDTKLDRMEQSCSVPNK